MSGDRISVLLDTDIGSDIDDAVCLAYLLANPACNLLGITTVSGEVVKRASIASALCNVAGKNIPIFPGREEPLLSVQKQPTAPQAAALSRWEHETEFPRGEAIDFLRKTIRANPGEVVLLGIGPMTNIAALFASDDEIPKLLKGLVLMCGVFSKPYGLLEWNAICDPTAAAIVYRAAPFSHRSIGLNVTMQVEMPMDEVRRKFQAPLLRPVADFAEVWFQSRGTMIFHDPLAAATIFDNSICGFESGLVTVELKSDALSGATLWSRGEQAGYHDVAMTVDPTRFFDHYFSFFK